MVKREELFIIPECYADTNLLETLAVSSVRFNHQKGCAHVATTMKNQFGDDYAIGFIDDDKRTIRYLEEFVTVAQNYGITVLKHTERNHFFVKISPAVEEFFLNAAKELGIDVTEFGFSSDLKTLTHYTKRITSNTDYLLRKLFNALKPSTSFSALANLLNYFRTHFRNASVEEINLILK